MPLLTRRSSRTRRRDANKHPRRSTRKSPAPRRADQPPIVARQRCDRRLSRRPRRPGARLARDRARRVRLHRRPDRLRQVDPDQDADPRARARRRRGRDRRPRHQRDARRPHAVPAPPHRHRLPGLQAAAEPHRLRQRRLRASGDRRAALADPPQGARRSSASSASRRRSTTTPTSSRAASSSASRSRAPSSTTRRCCSPTSRPATSTPRPRSGSCSCSTGSTAPARPSSSSPTTARWSTRCAAA